MRKLIILIIVFICITEVVKSEDFKRDIKGISYDIETNTLYLKSDFLLLGEKQSEYIVTLNDKINITVPPPNGDYINRSTSKLNIDFKKVLAKESDPNFPTSISASISNVKFNATYFYKRVSLPSYYFLSSNTTTLSQSEGGVIELKGSLLPTTFKSLTVLANSVNITNKCSATQSSLLCKVNANDQSIKSDNNGVVHLTISSDQQFNFTSQFVYNSLKILGISQNGIKGLVNITDFDDIINVHLFNGNYEQEFAFINNRSTISFDFKPNTVPSYSIIYKNVKTPISFNWNPVLFPIDEVSSGESLFQYLFIDFGKQLKLKAYLDNQVVPITFMEDNNMNKVPVGINFPYGVGSHKLYIQRTDGNLAKSNIINIRYLPALIIDYQCIRSYRSQNVNQTICSINGERFPLTTFDLFEKQTKLKLSNVKSNFTYMTFTLSQFLPPQGQFSFSFNDDEGTNVDFTMDSTPKTDSLSFTTSKNSAGQKVVSIPGTNLETIYKAVLSSNSHPDQSTELDCSYSLSAWPDAYKEYINCILPSGTSLNTESFISLYRKSSSNAIIRLSSNEISFASPSLLPSPILYIFVFISSLYWFF
ncbi:hypothetical protein CYY_002747 [Polysphondylium violaceum]|uniref:Uncharacterized protein n=1 Tax=Polysphondylium violaceum TaxID=133409 RepID=A0A8J4V9B8_9MYCE|nr:hypothetical protein CYY_002747 [Polysphondylium violaceum]